MFHKFIYKMTLITCSMSHFNRNSHFIRFTRATGCCKDPGIKNSTRRKNLPLQLVRNSEKSISNDLSSSKYPSTDSWPSPVFFYNAVHRERAFSAVQLNRSLGNIEREREGSVETLHLFRFYGPETFIGPRGCHWQGGQVAGAPCGSLFALSAAAVCKSALMLTSPRLYVKPVRVPVCVFETRR